jgi:hypothetical protein
VPLLSIDIEARFAKFQDALNSIERNTQKSANRMGLAFTALKATLAGLATGLTAGSLVAVVKNAIDAADHLNDLSKKTGIAVDTLGGLGFAAGQAGGDLESVAAAAGKLNKSLAEAAGGNKEFGDAFKALGINIKDASGNLKKADVVLAEIADKFAGYADGPEKAAISYRLLGKAGADNIALLNEGGKALRENIEYYKKYAGVTQDVADKADAFNDTMGKIHLLSGAVSRTIAAELLPALQGMADQLLRAKEGGDGFKTIIHDMIGPLGEFIQELVSGRKEATSFWDAILTHGTINPFRSLGSNIKAYQEDVDDLTAALERYKKAGSDTSGIEQALDGVGKKLRFLKSQQAYQAVEGSQGDYSNEGRVAAASAPATVKPRAPVLQSASGNKDDPAKKILEGQLKALERNNNDEREILASRNEFLQTYYQQDLIAIKDYYDARRTVQAEALRAQVANIDKELAILKAYKPKDERAAADRDNKVAELKDKKEGLQKAAGLETIKSLVEQDKAAKDFERTLQGINAQLLEQQGYAPQAAAIQFDQTNEPIKTRITTERDAAVKAGDTKAADARNGDLARLATLRNLSIARAELNGLDGVGARIQSDLSIATDRAQIRAQLGATTELESLRQVGDARLQAAADLKQVADAFDQVARASGDPSAIQHAKELYAEVEKLAASADLVRDRFKEAFSNPFESFLEKLMSGTATIKDAFKALFSDIGAQITKILSHNIAEQLFSKSGALGGAVDVVSGLFGGQSKVPVASAGVAGSIATAAGGAVDTTAAATAAATITTASSTALASVAEASLASQASVAEVTLTSMASVAEAAIAALATVAEAATAALAASGASSAGGALAKAAVVASANGNIFNTGNVIPFAKGGVPSVVSAPTFFPMKGGKTGLMGEAGPEAIMPLKRDHGGELAVTVVGERGESKLMPLTRDRSGRLAVKAFAAGGVIEREISNVIPFARGGVFGGTLPARQFATGGVVMRDHTSAPASAAPANLVSVVNGGDSSVTHLHVSVTPPAGSSAATAAQWGATAGRELQRHARRNG